MKLRFEQRKNYFAYLHLYTSNFFAFVLVHFRKFQILTDDVFECHYLYILDKQSKKLKTIFFF